MEIKKNNYNCYYCYFIISQKNNKTYIGITNNLEKRIKQHNGELKGGAKSTKSSSNWSFHTIIGKFNNKSEAMSFEWYWKHQQNRNSKWVSTKAGIDNKMKRLLELILDNKWEHINIINHVDIVNHINL